MVKILIVLVALCLCASLNCSCVLVHIHVGDTTGLDTAVDARDDFNITDNEVEAEIPLP